MSTMELEAQKASLAREILTTTDEAIIRSMWQLLKGDVPAAMPRRRKIGILDGKTNIVFHDDWDMTTEELLDLR